MSGTIPVERFTRALFALLEETFETTHGIYLDKDTTLAHSLAGLTAEQASRSIVPSGTTISSQVDHVKFYLETLERYMRGEKLENVDWPGSWQRKSVTADEWESMKNELQVVYRRISDNLKKIEDWDDEKRLGGALGIVVHTAYHLGAIRQMLLVVK